MSLANLLYRRSILTYVLLPFSLVYAAIVKKRRNYYHNNPEKIFQPKTIVISIGNIVIGGSGKTPFTIFIASLMKEMGYSVAVSHRGYKGKYENGNVIISDKDQLLPEAEYSGDEPLLLATKLPGIPIIVGKNRKKSIITLEQRFSELDFIILDDSFQHLRVNHHHDFVLFKEIYRNVSAPKTNNYVFPAGPLREPISALDDADTIVSITTNKPSYSSYPIPADKLLFGSFQTCRFYDSQNRTLDIEVLKNSRIALISAIGQPASFEYTVNQSGISFKKHFVFPDHHNYHKVIPKIIKKCHSENLSSKNTSFDFLLTTEKDWIKLKKYADLFPFIILSISFVPDNNNAFRDIIRNLYKQKQTL